MPSSHVRDVELSYRQEKNPGQGCRKKTSRRKEVNGSFYFKLIFGSYYFCFVQFSLFPMPKRKRGVTGDAASRREAIRKRERRVAETDEERNRRLTTMAQRGQERRAEKKEQRRIDSELAEAMKEEN
ncbi:hypothetical protein AVEN_220745-1 [Araneus ventricosus]|uniref:Uncharacterized protein n=1 Tax=Araneus ventricosus TaxID=182803 RepID=A0A4Y2X282_ARAVE|nr:hypothetical protein AVEN_220745-1 [Araneus ventricosus]